MNIYKRIYCVSRTNVKYFYTNIPLKESSLEGKFTTNEQEKILKVLNSSNTEDLVRFDITRARLKNIVNWKNKKGPFTSLSSMLEVDGLGENILKKFYESILSDGVSSNLNKSAKTATSRQKKDILSPILHKDEIDSIASAVGLHIESTGISWAKLQKLNNELVDWNYCDSSELPKKVLPVDTFNFAIQIIKSLPVADVYVFTSKSTTAPSSNAAKSPPYSQQLELSSMLLALINTSMKHNPLHVTGMPEQYPNKVYYLRNNLPARLFGVLIGTERVSTESTIQSIINGNENVPISCSKVVVEPTLVTNYNKCGKGYKDLMEQALLLVITFMDLCVYNNPKSLKAIRGSR